MKIFLIFTLYLISGPVDCFDVIGYSGGTVIIYCTLEPKNTEQNRSFCKDSGQKCVYLNPDKTPNSWDPKGRVSVFETPGFIKVIYRDLSLNDTGSYQCGGTGALSNTVNLNVKTDECCLELKTLIHHPGKSITINCSYPEEFNEKAKIFYKQDFNEFTAVISTSKSQKYRSSISETLKERFSISDEKESGVVSVRIRDVRKDDEGVYYCGVPDDEGASNYETFFTKVYLQITDSTSRPTPSVGPPAPTVTTPVITTVSIVVVLLLIGGAALLFFIVILKKKQGSTPPTRTNQSGSKEVPPPKDQDLTYSTLNPHKDQDLTYSTVSFHKNPGSPTEASVSVSKEETETEYATVKHPTAVE